jgi:hypothetical protein
VAREIRIEHMFARSGGAGAGPTPSVRERQLSTQLRDLIDRARVPGLLVELDVEQYGSSIAKDVATSLRTRSMGSEDWTPTHCSKRSVRAPTPGTTTLEFSGRRIGFGAIRTADELSGCLSNGPSEAYEPGRREVLGVSPPDRRR